LELVDRLVEIHCKHKTGEPLEIDLGDAIEILTVAYRLLEFEDDNDDLNEKLAVLSYLSKMTPPNSNRDKVWIMSETNRNVKRTREAAKRFSNAPDTKQQADIARRLAVTSPFLLMLRQNGLEGDGWRGLPFWWPVIIAPTEAETTVFADETPQARAASSR